MVDGRGNRVGLGGTLQGGVRLNNQRAYGSVSRSRGEFSRSPRVTRACCAPGRSCSPAARDGSAIARTVLAAGRSTWYDLCLLELVAAFCLGEVEAQLQKPAGPAAVSTEGDPS